MEEREWRRTIQQERLRDRAAQQEEARKGKTVEATGRKTPTCHPVNGEAGTAARGSSGPDRPRSDVPPQTRWAAPLGSPWSNRPSKNTWPSYAAKPTLRNLGPRPRHRTVGTGQPLVAADSRTPLPPRLEAQSRPFSEADQEENKLLPPESAGIRSPTRPRASQAPHLCIEHRCQMEERPPRQPEPKTHD